MSAFFGKYRGKVVANVDPIKLGRIQVICPTVLGLSDSSWAMPCTPYAGPLVGFFAIPPVGAGVWVEFEGGDPSHPIWSGCFWDEGELPTNAWSPEMKVWKTESVTLALNDKPGGGGLTLKVEPPAVPTSLTLMFDDRGITLDEGEGRVMGSNLRSHFRLWDRSSEVAGEHYVRDCIFEILFTSPGEWVNRPDFGCGLNELILETVNEEFIASTQELVSRSLAKWLGDLIKVEAVEVHREGQSLKVSFSYLLRSSGKHCNVVHSIELC